MKDQNDVGYFLLKTECSKCKCGAYTYLENERGDGLIVFHDMKAAKKARSQTQGQVELPVIIHRLDATMHQPQRGTNN